MNFYEWTLGKEYNAERTDGSDEVSLVCTDYSMDFDWCHPAISHIRWESRPLIRHILKWATNMSHGKQDLRQIETPAEFVPAGRTGRRRRTSEAEDTSHCRSGKASRLSIIAPCMAEHPPPEQFPDAPSPDPGKRKPSNGTCRWPASACHKPFSIHRPSCRRA